MSDECVTLDSLKKTGEYKVCSITAAVSLKNRINALCITEGKPINVLYVKNGKAIISGGGITVGVSRSVAQKINVYKGSL